MTRDADFGFWIAFDQVKLTGSDRATPGRRVLIPIDSPGYQRMNELLLKLGTTTSEELVATCGGELLQTGKRTSPRQGMGARLERTLCPSSAGRSPQS